MTLQWRPERRYGNGDSVGSSDVVQSIIRVNDKSFDETVEALVALREAGDCKIDGLRGEIRITRSKALIDLRIAIVAHFDKLLAHFQPVRLHVNRVASAQLTLM